MGRPAKVVDNVLVQRRVSGFYSYDDLISAYPFVDDIVHGVAQAFLEHHTRPLSKVRIVKLLSIMPVINTINVLSATNDFNFSRLGGKMNIGERHATALAAHLRIASMFLRKEFEKTPELQRSLCFGSDEHYPSWSSEEIGTLACESEVSAQRNQKHINVDMKGMNMDDWDDYHAGFQN